MRNKNLLVLLIVIVLILAVGAGSLLLTSRPDTLPEDSDLTAEAYVYVTAAGEGRWFELPQEATTLELRRPAADGSEIFNIIHLSPDGVYMEASSCDNQDCVDQGTVTLDNRHERILQNFIICLPNEVSIELYTREEVADMLDEPTE